MKYLTALNHIQNENLTASDQEILNTLTNYYQLLKNKKVPNNSWHEIKSPKNPHLADLVRNFRSFLSRELGIWSVANQTTAKLLTEEFNFKKGLEIMSGNAMWSKAFSDNSVEMIATDDLSWSKTSQTGNEKFHPVQNLDATSAITKYFDQVDFIIWSWAPDFSTTDVEIIRQYRKLPHKPVLLIVGEVYGHTNSEQFWDTVRLINLPPEIEQSFTSFDFINEKILRIE